MNRTVEAITQRLRERSGESRRAYLARMQRALAENPPKRSLSCGNLAHAYAASTASDRQKIRAMQSANLGIITAYNDMLSAHQPFVNYPELIKLAARELGCTAQVAAGVPAMCDGITQGKPGMELSLLSRDVVALSTAIGLSHNVFDGVLCLGVCDKIVPGMLIGALQFGHLPAGFIPAGPMSSGIANKEKLAVRQRYAEGKATWDELLETESASYHSAGTCTFYGTANSNQLLVELLGVQLPGSSFIHPYHPLRGALTRLTVEKVAAATIASGRYVPLYRVITEASVINAVVGLLATGGSTNHTLHLVAIAKAAGIDLTWEDFDALSKVVPLLARIYPNGDADINAFQEAGGTAFLVRELRRGGLLNEDVTTLTGPGLSAYELTPVLAEDQSIQWVAPKEHSKLPNVLRCVADPFDREGGLRLLRGNLGTSVIKTSAVKVQHRIIEAPCRIFDSQADLVRAFAAGELNRDVVAVLRFQGPAANGMPELHQVTPQLGVLQDRGFKVALVTDGRMSGASGKVPAAIHVSPEALSGGPLAKLRDGDLVRLDAEAGVLEALVDEQEWQARSFATPPAVDDTLGRNLFARMRTLMDPAMSGAGIT